MKVLFISNDPSIFESESTVRARMRTYAAEIGELHIISRAAVAQDTQEDGLYLHAFCPLPTWLGRILFLRTLVTRARKLINKYGIEVVSAQDSFEHGAVALRAVRNTSAKLHIQVHTDFCSPFFAKESRKNAMRVRMADSVLPHADGIRAVSERVKQGMVKRYGKRIIEPSVIPVSLDLPEVKSAAAPKAPLGELPFTFTLISVGRLEKEKRIDDAIVAVAKLREDRYPVGLLVVGEGRERARLTERARQLKIEPCVIFLGYREHTSTLLAQANVFIQTSAYEGYGRTYIEAAQVGVPMVVTDAGIIGEVFQHDKSALVCPVGDVDCLAREVSRLIEDTALRFQLAETARAAACAHLQTLGDIPSHISADLAHTIGKL